MEDNTKKTHDLPMQIIIGWGLGTLPMAIYFNSFNILALRFFTDFVGVTAAAAGLLIGLSKIYDAFTDPLMGVISDRTRTGAGRRRPYILIGGLACALSIFALFSLPSGMPADTAFWFVAAVVFAYATSYTVYNIPYMAMPSEISGNAPTRSLMMSWRVVAIGAGGLIAGALGPKIIEWTGGGAAGHRAMGAALAVGILGFAIFTFFMTKGAPDIAADRPRTRISFADRIKTIASNRPFLLLLGLKFFQLMGVAVSAGTLSFFVVWILERGYSDLGAIILYTTIGQMLGTPLWLRAARMIGKRNVFFISAAIFGGVSLTWLAAGPEEAFWLTSLRVFIKGLATGGILLVGQALLPDTVEYDRLRTGMRREGVLSGMYTTIEKFAFAIGTALTGLYLDAMGYVPKLRPGADIQPDSALTAIYYCQAWAPALSIAVAAGFVVFYRLDDDKLADMRSSAAAYGKP